MEALPGVLLELRTGCQLAQRQAVDYIQLLLTALPTATWAIGPPKPSTQSLHPSHATCQTTLRGPLAAFASLALQLPFPQQHQRPQQEAAQMVGASLSHDATGLKSANGGGSNAAEAVEAEAATVGKKHGVQQRRRDGLCLSLSAAQRGTGKALEIDRQRHRQDGEVQDLSGTWIKDRERSGSMEDAMNLMHLNGIVRQAVKLVRGVRIQQDDREFVFTVFSVISWFKVKEVYPLSGEEREFRRRDLRRGKALGRVEADGKHLQVQLRWSDPFGGEGTDYFRRVSEDELHIESVLKVAGQTAKYTTVYMRKSDRDRHVTVGSTAAGGKHDNEMASDGGEHSADNRQNRK